LVRKSSVLITGSQGLIGSRLRERLAEDGFDIVELDLKKGGNVLDRTEVLRSAKRVEGVVHLAAVSRVVDAYRQPLKAIRTNVLGTANVLEGMRRSGKSQWLVFGSSREIYGEVTKVPVAESFSLRPVNVYGATKLSGESIVSAYCANYGLRAIMLRFSNVYGGIPDHPTRVIPAFVRRALLKQDVIVNGGNQTFDFVHVDDAVEGIVSAIAHVSEYQNGSYRAYHLVSGKGTSIMTLAKKILKITNSKSRIKIGRSRTYDVVRFVGNPLKARLELGWEPRISLDKGLTRYVRLVSHGSNAAPHTSVSPAMKMTRRSSV
jgi:UDP-glucose 4-epimerase